MAILEKGHEIYNKFCSNFSMKVATPSTKTLELFYHLKEKGEVEFLLREMMKEFLTNLEDDEVVVEDGFLFRKVEVLEQF